MGYITKEHGKRLPTVRIINVTMRNFRSVVYGEVVLDCGRQFVPYGTKSDILGVYGQNGSGKTALIEALDILKAAMSGGEIGPLYADCVRLGSDFAELEFSFDLQYPTEPITVRKVVYSFRIRVEKMNEVNHSIKEALEEAGEFGREFDIEVLKRRVVVFDELLSIGGDIGDSKKRLQPAIDTSVSKGTFGPSSKRKFFFTPDQDTITSLQVSKHLASERSQSFIFSEETLNKFAEQDNYSPYLEVIFELNLFARRYFSVVTTKSTGMIQLNYEVPVWGATRSGVIMIKTMRPEMYTNTKFAYVENFFQIMSEVLSQLIPGMQISLKELSSTVLPDGKDGKYAEIIIHKDDMELPIRCISDGARKLISILGLLMSAYNGRSVTVAIDELDAGIFEHLLGEILEVFEESGKGQLIFTSHNLRPLEVLDKKFICFTTTNPNNRYYRLKNIGATNNLRSTYFREILLGEQDEEITKATKKHKIIAAFRKAGSSNGTRKDNQGKE